MRSRVLLRLAVLSLTSLLSAHGHAFCLTHTCNPKTTACPLDSFGCNSGGPALFWPSSCVSFDVQKDGSAKLQISYDTLHGVVVKAFQQWTDADCGEVAHPSIRVVDLGPVTCAKPEYNQSQPNANIVTFHDGRWTYTNAMETIALTSVFFDRSSGAIYGADIEINSDRYQFADGNPTGDQVDLNAALTHEVGHFLGLAHSDVPSATMYWMYSSEAVSLESDDVAAICASLPPDRIATSDDCTPRHGFSGKCAVSDSGCCAVAIGGPRSGALLFALFPLGLGLFLARRRLARRS